jgi:hypothetical protein
MARQSAILIPTSTIASATGPSDYVFSLLTTVAQSQLLFNNCTFVIWSPGQIAIAFYSSKGGAVVAASATCYNIPANQQTTFDLGQACDTISIVNQTSGTNPVYIKVLSVL